MSRRVVLPSILLVVTCSASSVCGAQLLSIPRYDKVQNALAQPEPSRARALQIFSPAVAAAAVAESPTLSPNEWHLLDTESRGSLLWANEPDQLLPGAQLNLGASNGALLTELAGVISGAWRISAATALAVETQDTGDEEGTSETGQDSTAAFKTFLAGGGNLSLQGVRPIAFRPTDRSNQYFLAVPRAWVDVPGLGTTDDVRSGGAEIGAEYQYHRLADEGSRPFLVFQLRGGLVVGSKEFYQGIGHSKERPFGYVAPALSFFVADQVKIGVTGFVGPSTFRDQPRVQVSLAILNKKDGANK